MKTWAMAFDEDSHPRDEKGQFSDTKFAQVGVEQVVDRPTFDSVYKVHVHFHKKLAAMGFKAQHMSGTGIGPLPHASQSRYTHEDGSRAVITRTAQRDGSYSVSVKRTRSKA